jgi:hypothetical protein
MRISSGGPFGTVPELLFEKKALFPTLQHILIAGPIPTATINFEAII